MFQSICLFCGSSVGRNPLYAATAEALAEYLADRQITLVYGGANVGLMGVLADTALKRGGRVVGVMPRSLVEREVAHTGLSEMHIVEGMQERKALMADLSDAFIAMPGAYGTLDELFEVLTWNQLSIIRKPVGLLNIAGFFDPMLKMLELAVDEKFLRTEHRNLLVADHQIVSLIERMEAFRPVEAAKWIERLKAGEI